MPGGKGKLNPFDITEISGADSLFESNGIIAESEKIAAEIFGSLKTLYSCAGATLSIQTMLALASSSGKRKIIAGRFSHKSLLSAAVLLDLDIDWITPPQFLSGRLSAEKIGQKIDSDTAAVFVTHIDYLGGICPLAEIAAICKKHNVPLLVDNAHGAYMTLLGLHPNKFGAAMVTDSAHKTLPTLTGAAYLHINDEKFLAQSKSMMSLFGSSSPSYLLLDSLDCCNAHLAQMRNTVFEDIQALKDALVEFGYTLLESDFLRITVNTAAYGYYGFDFAQLLHERKIECEYCDRKHVVLLFSTITTKSELECTYAAMCEIFPRSELVEAANFNLNLSKAMSIKSAFFSSKETLPVELTVDRICAEIKAPSPPCVPLVMLGEIIDKHAVEALKYYGVDEISVVKSNK